RADLDGTVWTLSGFADEISPDPQEQCAVLSRLGIRYLEMRTAWGVTAPELTDEQVTRLTAIFDGYRIRVPSIGPPIEKIPVYDDLGSDLRRFDRVRWLARTLSAPYIRLFSFYTDDPASHRDEVLRRMAALVDRAAGDEVVLLHENEKGIYGSVPERCRDIVE